MASYHEQGSDHDSSPNEKEIPSNSGYVLDNRRRAALAEVDNAKFSYVSFQSYIIPYLFANLRWFHAKVCIVAGVGFFTDA